MSIKLSTINGILQTIGLTLTAIILDGTVIELRLERFSSYMKRVK